MLATIDSYLGTKLALLVLANEMSEDVSLFGFG